MLIDTHCHANILANNGFDKPLDAEALARAAQILAEARAQGVGVIVNVGTSVIESHNCVALARAYEPMYAVVGIHPCDATPSWRADLQELQTMLVQRVENKIVAVGEIGLDFFHKPFDQARQTDAFRAQLELALSHNLPVVIHVRDAGDALLEVLAPYAKEPGLRGVIHCFSQDAAFAQQVLAWGFMVGLDGPIDYPKNEWLREVIRGIPLERIVLETDAPFLPPQKLRGKKNHPAYLPYIAQALADIKAVSLAAVTQQTTRNAQQLFGLPTAATSV